MKNHNQFYSYAEAYDLAFDFKDIASECEFFRTIFEKHNQRQPKSFLDLAAGPALHAIKMAKLGLSATALDLSREMVEYCQQKARKAGVTIEYVDANMCDFQPTRKHDLAGIFMDSTSYLLTNEDMIHHLRCVAHALNPNGIYILEMSHPRDVFSVGTSTVNSWETKNEKLTVTLSWGDPTDTFDPISQITDTTVRMKVCHNDKEEELVEKAPQRCFTANEFKALVQAEGSFELVATYGAMKATVPFSNDKSAWRMIPVLQKKT